MSELVELTEQVQRAAGMAEKDIDGKWGLRSATATLQKLSSLGAATSTAHVETGKQTASPTADLDTTERVPPGLDARSQRNIDTLQAWVQPLATRFLRALQQAGINAQIISGTRTFAEQETLYEQGRSKPGNIVTKARGGYSNHNFGVAFDIGIFSNSKYLEDSPLYARAGEIGKSLGFEWGGDWQFKDEPHFQLRPLWARNVSERQMLSELRRRTAQGVSLA